MGRRYYFILIFLLIIAGILFFFIPRDSSQFYQGCRDNHCVEAQISSKNTNKTLDIIFIPANSNCGERQEYAYSKFLADTQEITSKMFSISPFRENQNKFNIYYYKLPVECDCSKGFMECYLDNKLIEDLSPDLDAIGYFDLYILLESRKDEGGLSGTVTQSTSNPRTVIHEIAHSLGVNDESFDSPNLYLDDEYKSTNLCSNKTFNCCGGRLCSEEIKRQCLQEGSCEKSPETECCVPIVEGQNVYVVPYKHLMKYGTDSLVLSDATYKIINYSLFNWEDVYAFTWDESINKSLYVADWNRKRVVLEEINNTSA